MANATWIKAFLGPCGLKFYVVGTILILIIHVDFLSFWLIWSHIRLILTFLLSRMIYILSICFNKLLFSRNFYNFKVTRSIRCNILCQNVAVCQNVAKWILANILVINTIVNYIDVIVDCLMSWHTFSIIYLFLGLKFSVTSLISGHLIFIWLRYMLQIFCLLFSSHLYLCSSWLRWV